MSGRSEPVVPLTEEPDRAASIPGPAPTRHPGGVVGVRLARRDQLTRRLLVLADVGALLLALLLAGVIPGYRPDDTTTLVAGLPMIPVFILLFKLYGLYDRDLKRISHSATDDLPWLFHALVLGTLGLWLYLRFVPDERLIFSETLTFAVSALVATLLGRSLVRRAVIWLLGPERVLIGGEGAMPELLIRRLTTHPEYSLEPIAMLAPNGRPPVKSAPDSGDGELPILGGASDLERVIRERSPERLIVCRPDFSPDEVLEMIDTCHRYSVKVSVVPGTVDAFGPSLEVDQVEGVTVLGVNPLILGPTSRALKRGFDLLVAGTILLLAAPLMAVIAIGVKLDSPGSVFFRQPRIGRGGRPFDVIKFRSMSVGAEKQRARLMSESRDGNWLDLEHDPRVTKLGGLLRRSSLDELPQLLNVLRGEMSMVGPRPLPAEEDAQVGGRGRGRLDLTPGITGLWQVLGRTQIPFDEMVKLDYIYVTNWSLWWDVKILFQTVPVVFGRRGY